MLLPGALGQPGGLADTAPGGCTTPWGHWAGGFGSHTPGNGQMSFGLALGLSRVAGEEGVLPASQEDECEGKSRRGFL